MRRLLFLLAFLATPALPCEIDTRYTPTPTFRWTMTEIPPDLAAFKMRWRWYGSTGWSETCCQATLPCLTLTNEDTGETGRWCPGLDLDVPIQRYTNAQYPDELEVCVSAILGDGTEGECTLADMDEWAEGVQTRICMPHLRRFP